MQCPKCPGEMVTKTYSRNILVHRCDGCGGFVLQTRGALGNEA